MRPLVIVGLVCGIGGAAAGQPPAVDYKPSASAAGKYKVLFPGPYKSETTEVKTPTGPRKLTLDSVGLEGGLVFVVTYVDVPDEVAKSPPGPRLDKVRDANKGQDGRIVSEKAVEFGPDKLPARDLLIEKPAGLIRNRVVIADARLYQVMIQGPREFVTSKAADEFFESFEITK